LSQNVELLRCPSCGSTNITFDSSTLIMTCNRCGVKCQVIAGYRVSEEATFSGSSVAGTLPPKPVLQTEEIRLRKVTQEIFPHTHEEIRKIERDISRLKKKVRKIEELLTITPQVVVVEEISKEEAKRRIIQFLEDYMKIHERVYPSDVADALGLKYELVREIFDILEKEGKLEKKVP